MASEADYGAACRNQIPVYGITLLMTHVMLRKGGLYL